MTSKSIQRLLKVTIINIASFGTLIGVWWLASHLGGFNHALFPTPLEAYEGLAEIIADGSLLIHTKDSMIRFALGYGISVVLGVLLGLVLGWWWSIFKFVNPIVQLLRPISPLAWMPFIVLWFGIGEVPAIVIIFIAAFFPVLLSTVNAVKNIEPVYFKVSRNFDIKQPEILWKVIFPAAFPGIASGAHLALGTAWVFLVCGEMTGAQTGLGYLIIDARNNLRADILLADIVVIGIIGLFLDTLLRIGEDVMLKKWGLKD